MGQNAPYYHLEKLPPKREQVETIKILRQKIVLKLKVSVETKEVVNYRKAIFYGFNLLEMQGFIRVNDIVGIQQELIEILKQ